MPPGPSTANLSSYAPNRQVFSDASGIVNAEIAGLGDANVNPLMDIVEGIDKGLDLAYKANKFIESISPQAAEERRLNLEIKRSQAAVQQQQAQAAQIQMEADALTKESTLLNADLAAQQKTTALKDAIKQGQVLQSAYQGLGQIQDVQSFKDYLNDPTFNILRTNPDFGKLVASKGITLLGTTNDPMQQVDIYRSVLAASPGSEKALTGMLSTEAQRLIASPTDLAEIDLKRAQASKANQEVADAKSVEQRRQALANKPPYDPIAAALGTDDGAAPTAPQPTSGVPNISQPGTTGGSVATGAATNPAADQSAVPGQAAAPVDTRPEKVQQAEKIFYSEDQKKAVVDRLVVAGAADTPSRELQQMVFDDIAARNPEFGPEQIASAAKNELENLKLQPHEFEERQKLTAAIPQMETALQRIDAALQTIDEYKAVKGDPNLGPDNIIGRQADILEARTIGSEDKKKLVSAYAELDASGVNAAMQAIAASGLTGPLTALMSNEQERNVLQSLQTGSNISEERNRQAREILAAKLHQTKEVARIIDAHQAAHIGFEDATRAAARWVAANPVTEVGRINGAPEVVAKKKLPTANDYLFNKLDLGKYVERNKAGRATTPPQTETPRGASVNTPSGMVDEVLDLVDKKSKGEDFSIPHPSDIPDKLKTVSPALLKRMTYRESGFDPNAVSKAGAKGLTQLMDGTGKDLWKAFNWDKEGPYDPSIPEKNVLMGMTYMNQMLKTFNYDTRLALAAYNAGPGKLGDVIQAYKNARNGLGSTDFEAVKHWLPKETRDHVKFIMEDDSDPRTAKPTLTTLEYRGAIDSLPTEKSKQWAEQNLSTEGQHALKETANIKRIADTKGTILEDVVSALWSANPFAATTAEAQEPEEETGSDDTSTRVLNPDSSVSIEAEPTEESSQTYPDPETGMPITIPSLEEDESGRRIFEELNPFRGAETANAEIPDEGTPEAAERGRAALAKIDAAGKPQTFTSASREGIQVSPWEKTRPTRPTLPNINTEGMADGMQAFLLGAAREILFGGDDEMAAKYRMAAHGETWDQATANARAIRDANQKAYPWVYFGGQVGGALLNPVGGLLFKGAKSVLSATNIVKAAPKATKVGEVLKGQTPSMMKSIGKGSVAGAAGAAPQGFLEAEGGLENRIDRALQSTLLGLGFGGAIGAAGKAVSNKLSSGQLTKEQIAVLKEWANMSDEELAENIAKLSSKNPDASILSEIGVNKVREHIAKMAKNPRVIDEAIDIAEGQVAREVEAVSEVLNKYTRDIPSEKAAKDLSIVVKGQVKEFYKELHDIGDEVYDKARAAASKNTVMSKGRYARLKKALPAQDEKIIMGEQGAVRSGALGSSDKLFDASGKPLTNKVQRYEVGINHSTERPAFVSDQVFRAMDSNLVAGYVERAQKLLEDLEGGLQANDFEVLTLARSMMRDEAYEMGGTAGKVLKDAEQRLEKAMGDEVPEWRAANEAYEAKSKTLRENYSKGLKKLESYAIEGGQLDSRTIHKDLMSMGPEEIKAAMKGLDPEDQEVYKNSVRSFILDSLEKRGERQRGAATREFPNFTKNSGDKKIKAILGDEEGGELISKLQQQERITTVANKLIKEGETAKNKAIEEGKELTQRFGLGAAGLATAMTTMGAFGPSQYTIGFTILAGHRALKDYIRKAAFKSEEEMAEGIAKIVYQEPNLGLDLLEEVSKHVQKEIPEYYPTWAKVAAGASQILVAGGDNREPQTTARKQMEAEKTPQ